MVYIKEEPQDHESLVSINHVMQESHTEEDRAEDVSSVKSQINEDLLQGADMETNGDGMEEDCNVNSESEINEDGVKEVCSIKCEVEIHEGVQGTWNISSDSQISDSNTIDEQVIKKEPLPDDLVSKLKTMFSKHFSKGHPDCSD